MIRLKKQRDNPENRWEEIILKILYKKYSWNRKA